MRNVKKKGLAALLALCLMLSLISYPAFAEGGKTELPKQELSWQQQEDNLIYGNPASPVQANNKTQGGGKITYSSSNQDVATIEPSNGALVIKGVGTTTITATAAEVQDKYAKTEISYILTVQKRPVDIEIQNKEREYYLDNPPLTFEVKEVDNTVSGLVNSDTTDAIKMELTTVANTLSVVGKYEITGEFLGSKNYEVKKIRKGTLTIKKRTEQPETTLTIKAKKNMVETVSINLSSAFSIYNLSDIEIPSSPVQNDDSDIILDGSVKRTGNTTLEFKTNSKENGTATINVITKFKNYENGKATINVSLADKKSPQITGITLNSKIYDGQVLSYEGKAMIDDSIAEDATIEWKKGSTSSSSIPAPKTFGDYYLVITTQPSADYEEGKLILFAKINPRPISVKPTDVTLTQGEAKPNFTLEFENLVAGENITTNNPKFKVLKADGTEVNDFNNIELGTYRIQFANKSTAITSGGINDNYDIKNMQVKEGVLTVNPKENNNQNQNNNNQNNNNQNNNNSESTSEGTYDYSPSTPNTTEIKTEDKTSTASVDVSVKKTEKQVSAKVEDKALEEAVKALDKEVKAKKTQPQLEIKLDTAENTEEIKLELSKKAVETLVNNKVEALNIESKFGSLSLDKKALEATAKQVESKSLTLNIAKAEEKLNEKQKEVIGGQPVYDITLLDGEKEVKNFDGGMLTIELPYELRAGELPNRIAIWYVDDMGNIEKMDAMYSVKTKGVIFTTTHLSKYAIVHENWMNNFKDVKDTDWFYAAVKYIAERDLMKGVKDDMFGPEEKTTRAMFVTILHRMEGSPAAAEMASFKDVEAGKYYADAVNWASANGIVKGVGNELFAPNMEITREQAALILKNYADFKKMEVKADSELAKFEDRDEISPWATDALKWTVNSNIIKGKSETMLAPQAKATRAELSQILMNFMELSK